MHALPGQPLRFYTAWRTISIDCDQRDIALKSRILENSIKVDKVRKACRYFGVLRSTFYTCKKAYEVHGFASGAFEISLPIRSRYGRWMGVVWRAVRWSSPMALTVIDAWRRICTLMRVFRSVTPTLKVSTPSSAWNVWAGTGSLI